MSRVEVVRQNQGVSGGVATEEKVSKKDRQREKEKIEGVKERKMFIESLEQGGQSCRVTRGGKDQRITIEANIENLATDEELHTVFNKSLLTALRGANATKVIGLIAAYERMPGLVDKLEVEKAVREGLDIEFAKLEELNKDHSTLDADKLKFPIGAHYPKIDEIRQLLRAATLPVTSLADREDTIVEILKGYGRVKPTGQMHEVSGFGSLLKELRDTMAQK